MKVSLSSPQLFSLVPPSLPQGTCVLFGFVFFSFSWHPLCSNSSSSFLLFAPCLAKSLQFQAVSLVSLIFIYSSGSYQKLITEGPKTHFLSVSRFSLSITCLSSPRSLVPSSLSFPFYLSNQRLFMVYSNIWAKQWTYSADGARSEPASDSSGLWVSNRESEPISWLAIPLFFYED